MYTVYAKTSSDQHWEYIKSLLENCNMNPDEIRRIGFHYKTAFIHGFKHGVEWENSLKKGMK